MSAYEGLKFWSGICRLTFSGYAVRRGQLKDIKYSFFRRFSFRINMKNGLFYSSLLKYKSLL